MCTLLFMWCVKPCLHAMKKSRVVKHRFPPPWYFRAISFHGLGALDHRSLIRGIHIMAWIKALMKQ